jgi:putrescine:ornithine antiporter
MIVLGVVQTLLALTTASPTLSETFGVLVNLAVVTNVVPYIVALSALPLMMKVAGVAQGKYRLNVVVLAIALLYSLYAIYASGKDAVFGGMIVLGVAYIIWGTIAHRFAPGAAAPATSRASAGKVAALLLAVGLAAVAAPASAATLDTIRESGRIRLGYRTDAPPLSYREASGGAAGYSVALCSEVVEAVKRELGTPALEVEWVAVTVEDRFRALAEGRIDLLCGASTATLSRRAEVSFSIPTFPGGIGAVIRADAAARLREALEGKPQPDRPAWRGVPSRLLQAKSLAVVGGTTAETRLAQRLDELQVVAETVTVKDYQEGIRRLLEGQSDAFFGDRILLLGAIESRGAGAELALLDRLFTHEPLALALPRGDEDLRLLVDRTLSGLYRSGEIEELYGKWCGDPDETARSFFRMNALPE